MGKAVDRISEFNRFGSVLGLERMTELLKRLDHPERGLGVIHVAGTNGKGSVCTFISSILLSAGYSVGNYSSPAMEVFNDRITFAAPGHFENIPDEDLEKHTDTVLETVSEMVSEGLDTPTEFEIVTAICFLYFRDKGPDFVVLEVGLGGRGDSTNVIEKPLVTVITSISYDHTDRLGNTLSEIAFEKAGIARAGVPMVSNAASPEAKAVIEKITGNDFVDVSGIAPSDVRVSAGGSVFTLPDYPDIRLSMIGGHQCENAKTALYVIDNLVKRDLAAVSRRDIYSGLFRAVRPCRFEVFEKGSLLVILDGAHNPAGAEMFRETLCDCMYSSCDRFSGRLIFVTAILKDKDVRRMTETFIKAADGFSDVTFIVTEIDNERAMPAEALSKFFDKRKTVTAAHAKEAAEKAFLMAGRKNSERDVIVFAGSLYLLSEIRKTVMESVQEFGPEVVS